MRDRKAISQANETTYDSSKNPILRARRAQRRFIRAQRTQA